MSAWPASGDLPPLPRGVGSPSEDRRGGRGAFYDDTDGYGRDRGAPQHDADRADWLEWERRRAATRGRSRSPPYFDEARRKRRSSFSPPDRDRYEPRARYDADYRDSRRGAPDRRGGRVDPYESDAPVPFRAYAEWLQSAHPDDYAEDERATAEAVKNGDTASSTGLKLRYERYRKSMINKQADMMFNYHRKSPWFNEKYNPASPYKNLRLRVRREGWDGLLDQFIAQLEEGAHDPELVFPTDPEPASPVASRSGADTKLDVSANGDELIAINGSGVAETEMGNNEEASNDGQSAGANDAEQREPRNSDVPHLAAPVESADVPYVAETANGRGDENPSDKPDLRDRIDSTGRQRPGDDVTVETEGNQVLIRTIPPDIGRVKIERICREVPGFIYLALGDTMQKRNYYRAGWIKFKEDADMTSVIDRLSEAKIEGFKLHVTHSPRPFSSRARFAPEYASRPERVKKDLANIKKLALVLENETADLLKLPETLPEPRNLPKSKGGDLPDPMEVDPQIEGSEGDQDKKVSNRADIDPMVVDDMTVDPSNRLPQDRGSAAVEARVDKLLEEYKNVAGDVPDLRNLSEDDLQEKRNDIALDLYLAYVRKAFNCCYYCSAVTDHVEELQRKCIKHIRRRSSAGAEPWRDERWEEGLDSKTTLLIDRDTLDPRLYGGKLYEEELSKVIEPFIKQEDEGKFRCKSCNKLFKATSFVEKHIAARHPELLKDLEDLPFYNNFQLDPHKIQPFSHPPPPNANGQSAPNEAFGLRPAPNRVPGPRDTRGGGYPPYPPYSGPPSGYYPPPPPYGGEYYGREPFYYPPQPPQHAFVPPSRGGYGGGFDGRRSPPRGGGRLSERVGGYATYDGVGKMLEPGPGPRGRRRDSLTADPMVPSGPPPPGAKEDPRAAAGRKVSYIDIDKTAEGDVELSY